MVTLTDDITELIDGCRSNKRWAQEQLYRRFYRYAMVIALRYSRDEMDAADILSHAFVKVFRSIHSFDSSRGSFQAWLKRIVVNEGLDHIKSRERFSEHMELETVDEPAVNNSVLERMGADEIMKMIHRLPPATHAVFVLYAVEGYNHREIAEKLNIREGTSKWHLSEARKTLQNEIRKQNPK